MAPHRTTSASAPAPPPCERLGQDHSTAAPDPAPPLARLLPSVPALRPILASPLRPDHAAPKPAAAPPPPRFDPMRPAPLPALSIHSAASGLQLVAVASHIPLAQSAPA